MEKTLRIVTVIILVTAIVELALSQLCIKIIRLSAEELTGISYFGFIIFGLVTLFTVSRMKDSFFGRLFAVIMNFVTAFAGAWCLRLLVSDEIFFRNLYYSLNRQTQVYELLTPGGIISASIPLVLIAAGTVIYGFGGLVIMAASIVEFRKKQN